MDEKIKELCEILKLKANDLKKSAVMNAPNWILKDGRKDEFLNYLSVILSASVLEGILLGSVMANENIEIEDMAKYMNQQILKEVMGEYKA